MNNETTLDVARVVSIIRDRWKIVLAVTVIVTSMAWVYVSFLAHPVYQATALVTYQEPGTGENPTGGVLPSNDLTRENIATLVGATSNPVVVSAAAKTAGITADDLRLSVKVQPHGEASIIEFVARAASAKQAEQRANAWANAFIKDRATRLTAKIDERIAAKKKSLASLGAAKIDDPLAAIRATTQSELDALTDARIAWNSALTLSNPARTETTPVWPKTKLTLLAALLIGFGLGSGVALLTARVDDRLKGDEFDDLPAPVLVRVPRSPKAPKSQPMAPSHAEPLVADSFAALGARVMLDRTGDGAHVMLVTSARSGEGKSSVAANLASALAQGGRRVVLLDADMRRPTQDIVFPMLQGRPGLSQVLTRTAELESALTLVSPNLAAVASGPRHANASMLLASVAFRQMVDRLSQISEVIVIDAPPVLAVNDALAVAPAAQQVLVCARVDASSIGELREAHVRLASAASTPQALVLVGTERPTGYGYDQELRPAAPGARVAMPTQVGTTAAQSGMPPTPHSALHVPMPGVRDSAGAA